MEQLFTSILSVHAIAGGIALLSGSVNMIRRKGGSAHTKIGLIYFYTVLVNACCAFLLASYHPNLFLFSLGVLSFYLVYTGRRFLLKSKKEIVATPQTIDWILNISLLLFGFGSICYSIYCGLSGSFNFIPIVFGGLSLFLSLRVLLKIRSKTESSSNELMKAHIGSMIGSYITIFSAFLVVNNHGYYPVLLGWFGPSVLFIPFNWIWMKKYASG